MNSYGEAPLGPAISRELEPRELAVLRAVIQEHVATGEPIGSVTISRGTRLALSPATIRGVLATLEELGLLTQPHTSSGRVPTARAWRIYLDRLMPRLRLTSADAQEIELALTTARGGVDSVLAEASRQLSRLSNQVGIVVAPELGRMIVERLEFVRIDPRRAVAILVGRSGVVHNRLVDLESPLEQHELDRISRYLSSEFGGHTLPEIRALLGYRMREDRAAWDRWVARGLELGQQTVETGEEPAEVFVEGAFRLLAAPEFSDPGRARELVQALEEKRALIGLLGRMLDGRGVRVVLGDEFPAGGFSRCAVVASSYGAGGRVLGTLGVVGPARMEYPRAIALVTHLARVLSRCLPGLGN